MTGVPASPSGSRPSDGAASSGVSPAAAASIPNAEEVAEAAAACLKPELFEPFIRKAADDFYERLLDGVQDYLVSNAGFNIGGRISAAEREAANLRAECKRYRDALIAIGGLSIQSHFVTDSTMRSNEVRCLSAYGVGKILEEALHPAQAIEARRAATAKTGAVEDESAVPKGCAQ